MGLIAHQLENAGISTVSISSARDITTAVKTPRASFLDFPLGHTTGKPWDLDLSYEIVLQSVSLVEQGSGNKLKDLSHRWSDSDDWKDEVFPAGGPRQLEDQDVIDDRLERWEEPQYQTQSDLEASFQAHHGEECEICRGIDF